MLQKEENEFSLLITFLVWVVQGPSSSTMCLIASPTFFEQDANGPIYLSDHPRQAASMDTRVVSENYYFSSHFVRHINFFLVLLK